MTVHLIDTPADDTGRVLAELPDGAALVAWSDGTTSATPLALLVPLA